MALNLSASIARSLQLVKSAIETLQGQAVPSPDGGNLIQQRANGLYAALAAPANVSNLYVDSVNGNDNNAGTQASPIQTIQRAAYLINTLGTGVGTYTVHLKSGQTFTTAGIGGRLGFNASQVNFSVYGEPKYTNSSGFVDYFPTSAIDFQRATIVLGSYNVGDGTLHSAGISTTGNVYFEGIVLQGPTDHVYGGSEMVTCGGGNAISFFGCDVNIGCHVFVTNNTIMDACVLNFQNVGSQSFFTTAGCRGPIVINSDGAYAYNSPAKQYPGEAAPRPAYTARTMAMRSRINRVNFADGQDWSHDPVSFGASISYYITA